MRPISLPSERSLLDGSLAIAAESPDQEDVVALLDEGLRYLRTLFSAEESFALGLDELMASEVTVLVARIDGTAVGCGGIKDEGSFAEIKRMFVDERVRGLGVGSALLDRLVELARSRGFHHVRLETGIGLDTAIALYERSGFVTIPAYGVYVGSTTSVCMEKRLV